MTDTARPKIAVLLATYNGAARLRDQLDSYATQSVTPDLILISDDGSKDNTRSVIADFAAEHPALQVDLVEGPKRGSARNFLSLMQRCPDWVDIIALSDQDDVWLPDKLRRGMRRLQEAEQFDLPLLYCGRSWECNEALENRRLSRGLKRPATFRHALVQSVAGGNTMMLNRAALDLVQGASAEARKLVVHDWWLYQIVTGVGGRVLFDDAPLLLYRQHADNLIGANRGIKAKITRLKMLGSGRFRRWNTVNIAALTASAHRLTPENRAILQMFSEERNLSLPRRVSMLRKTGLYRQGLQGRMSLYLAAVLRRI